MPKSIFPPLTSVTAKLKLSAGELIYHHIKISQATLQATIAGGKLNATLPSFKLYDGAGALALDVDASGKSPTQRDPLCRSRISMPTLSSGCGGI